MPKLELHTDHCLCSLAAEPLKTQLQAQGAASLKEGGLLSKLWRQEEHRCDTRQYCQACHRLLSTDLS